MARQICQSMMQNSPLLRTVFVSNYQFFKSLRPEILQEIILSLFLIETFKSINFTFFYKYATIGLYQKDTIFITQNHHTAHDRIAHFSFSGQPSVKAVLPLGELLFFCKIASVMCYGFIMRFEYPRHFSGGLPGAEWAKP